jgi:hypothetical protein
MRMQMSGTAGLAPLVDRDLRSVANHCVPRTRLQALLRRKKMNPGNLCSAELSCDAGYSSPVTAVKLKLPRCEK